MEFVTNNYENEIKKCIKYSFKSCKEISDQTGINSKTVTRYIIKFRKYDLIYIQLCENKNKAGISPYKYKLK